jgi:hypothetical protein
LTEEPNIIYKEYSLYKMTELLKIQEELSELRVEISKLREDIQQLVKTCGRMDTHISFVNNVYSTVRKPLEFIVNMLPFQITEETLPEIENNKD